MNEKRNSAFGPRNIFEIPLSLSKKPSMEHLEELYDPSSSEIDST